MTTHSPVRTATWEKPGPGTWELDSSHSGPAPCRIQRALYQEGLATGTAEGFALFGAPLVGMELRWVHGKFYRRLVPLVGGSRDLPRPPAAAVWLMTRLHPAFRRRERLAAKTLAERGWRRDLQRWDEEWKPSIIATNERLTSVAVGGLSDADLAAHLDELWAHARSTTTLHFRLHASDLGPMGLLMLRLQDWG
ncbi:MAG: hypothetical protein H0U26_03785, partial [Acidimicrobiia bacterium]|nr:hypothetical protein [Acidimicrobiia bacterium]